MREPFGTAGQQEVYLYTLTNINGITLKITNYGAIITSIRVPDKNNRMGDIVLGYDTLEQYIANSPYFGAMVGRYANRIAKGKIHPQREKLQTCCKQREKCIARRGERF